MLEYHAHYFKTDDGWYVVEVVDFPGVSSQGKTLRSARGMIRDALNLMAEWIGRHSKPKEKEGPKLGGKPVSPL